MAAVPLAMLRARRIVWLIPPLVFALVTIGGVAILATGAKGGLCDCGYGAGVTATCGGARLGLRLRKALDLNLRESGGRQLDGQPIA